MDRVAHAVSGYLKDEPPSFQVGDTVDVKVRIKEGDKERVQTFTGVVIGMKGRGISRTFTVRRIVGGEGVERVFPIHSPFVQDVVTKKRAKIRRAKLYYLRERTGKRARMKERLDFKVGKEKAKAKAAASAVESVEEPAEQPSQEPAAAAES